MCSVVVYIEGKAESHDSVCNFCGTNQCTCSFSMAVN